MQFGEKLKELRSQKGMTQKDLAERINISPQAVSRWENNEVEPSLETLRRLAEIFDVSMDDLFGKEKRAEPQASHQPFPEQKVVLAVCEGCNTPIFEAENLFRYTDKNGQKSVFCKSCQLKNKQKELQEEYAAADKELKEKRSERKKGYIFGGLIGGVFLLIGIAVAIAAKNAASVLFPGVIGILAFMGFFCVYAGDSVIGDMGATVMGWSFHAPGILFEWSAEGIFDLIVLKIIFWIIGLLVGICTFLLGLAVITVCSPFAFPYDVYAVNRDVRVLRKKADDIYGELKKLQSQNKK